MEKMVYKINCKCLQELFILYTVIFTKIQNKELNTNFSCVGGHLDQIKYHQISYTLLSFFLLRSCTFLNFHPWKQHLSNRPRRDQPWAVGGGCWCLSDHGFSLQGGKNLLGRFRNKTSATSFSEWVKARGKVPSPMIFEEFRYRLTNMMCWILNI